MTRDEQRTLDGLASIMELRLNAQDTTLSDIRAEQGIASERLRLVELNAAKAAGVSSVLKALAAICGSGLCATLITIAYYVIHTQ